MSETAVRALNRSSASSMRTLWKLIRVGNFDAIICARDGRAWKIILKKILWPRLFRLADQVIVPSSGALYLMLSLGLPSKRVTLTPYSVENDWWIHQSSRVDRAATRAEWRASPNQAVVLFCAKLQPWKRPGDLLRAFAKADVKNALLLSLAKVPFASSSSPTQRLLASLRRFAFLAPLTNLNSLLSIPPLTSWFYPRSTNLRSSSQ
jgi:hypothetical protein